MGQFNTKLVESLNFLNKVLAVIFVTLAAYKFWDNVSDNIFAALFESVTVVGAGILTCGYIALMLNINNVLAEIRDQRKQ